MWRFLNYLLYPFSVLYGLVLWLRNRLYDNGLLTSVEFDLPVIAVGNLSVGGTGKTPHVEYLIRLLKGVPKSHVYRIVRSGEVRVNSSRVGPEYRLASGDRRDHGFRQ